MFPVIDFYVNVRAASNERVDALDVVVLASVLQAASPVFADA